MKASENPDERNVYKPLLDVYEYQTKAWEEMRKVLLKDAKEHKNLLGFMKQADDRSKKLSTSQ